MPKAQAAVAAAVRKRGRPAAEAAGPLRSVEVMLDELSLARARMVGAGNVSLGVRIALRKAALRHMKQLCAAGG